MSGTLNSADIVCAMTLYGTPSSISFSSRFSMSGVHTVPLLIGVSFASAWRMRCLVRKSHRHRALW